MGNYFSEKKSEKKSYINFAPFEGDAVPISDKFPKNFVKKLKKECEEFVSHEILIKEFVDDLRDFAPTMNDMYLNDFAKTINRHSEVSMDESNIYIKEGQFDIVVVIIADSIDKVNEELEKQSTILDNHVKEYLRLNPFLRNKKIIT